jgi:multidrug efflux pump subunit AcrA (membrane-fusion protein)
MYTNIARTAYLLIAVLVGCLGCGEEANTGVDKKAEGPQEKWVRIRPVEASETRGQMEYVGVLLANRKVKVSSELGGLIERLCFEKGDEVKEGVLLAEVGATPARLQVKEAAAVVAAAKSSVSKLERGSRPQEIQIGNAEVSAAEAAMMEAEKNFQRIKKLVDIQAVSPSAFDAAERELVTARAALEGARQQLVLALEGPRMEDIQSARASLAQAEAAHGLAWERLNKAIIEAPCDGVSAFREVEEGEIIQPGTPITEIVELGKMKIKIALSEKDLETLRRQREFPFTVDAIPGKEFSCHLFFVSPTADRTTRSFPVELMVDQPDPTMADGMTVRVRFPVSGERTGTKVPSAWLTEEDGKIGVYTFEYGKALFRPVTLGAYYDNRVEVLKGLQEGDLIITNPAGLKDGDAVKVKENEDKHRTSNVQHPMSNQK